VIGTTTVTYRHGQDGRCACTTARAFGDADAAAGQLSLLCYAFSRAFVPKTCAWIQRRNSVRPEAFDSVIPGLTNKTNGPMLPQTRCNKTGIRCTDVFPHPATSRQSTYPWKRISFGERAQFPWADCSGCKIIASTGCRFSFPFE
jgi:hypothetical protein